MPRLYKQNATPTPDNIRGRVKSAHVAAEAALQMIMSYEALTKRPGHAYHGIMRCKNDLSESAFRLALVRRRIGEPT